MEKLFSIVSYSETISDHKQNQEEVLRKKYFSKIKKKIANECYRPFKTYTSDFLINNFQTVSSAAITSSENKHLYFEEKIKSPVEFDTVQLASEGFPYEITIPDFPLRAKFVYLHIKRHH